MPRVQAGEPVDRGLQLGSGRTEILAGVSYFRRPAPSLGWFAQIVGELPLNYRAGFMPSANIAANAGIRWLNTTAFTPQLQLNARWDAREHGVNADPANSGGMTAYLSPGVTVEVGTKGSAFAFVQVPVCRTFNGLHLAPDVIVSLGVNWRL